jgi:hypothetical protein
MKPRQEVQPEMITSAGSAAAEPPGALEDPEVIAAAKEYLRALESGEGPRRQEFLARYPAITEALAECLDGLEFVHAADPRLPQPALDALSDPVSARELHSTEPLGDYRILREIVRGGMGVVYEAEQMSLGRKVALKVLPFAGSAPRRSASAISRSGISISRTCSWPSRPGKRATSTASYRPQAGKKDLRSWEWDYLRAVCERELLSADPMNSAADPRWPGVRTAGCWRPGVSVSGITSRGRGRGRRTHTP